MARYDEVVAAAQSCDELTGGFLAKLETTLRQDARMHRLWYDLGSQAMFEAAFRRDVLDIDKSLEAMIWRVASRYAELGAHGRRRPLPRYTRCSAACFRARYSGIWRTTPKRSPTCSTRSDACCRQFAEDRARTRSRARKLGPSGPRGVPFLPEPDEAPQATD